MSRIPELLQPHTRTVLATLIFVFASLVSADESSRLRPGPIEKLQQKLVAASDLERLLNSAERRLQAGESDPAFRIIRHVLSQPYDAFVLPPPAADPDEIQGQSAEPTAAGSLQRAAVELLAQATPTVRRQWIDVYEPLAARDLNTAIQQGDLTAVRAVARGYPWTQAAVQSLRLQCLTALNRGQPDLAVQLLSHLKQTYTSVVLPYSVSDVVNDLQTRILTQVPGGSDTLAELAGPAVGTPYSQPVAELSAAWTEPLWFWQESIWRHPDAVVPLSTIAERDQAQVLSGNAWQALLNSRSVLFRSPLRIVSFDRLSGQVQWTLPTDTTTRANSQDLLNSVRLESRRSVDADTLLRMERMGTMTADDRFLYFIDRFRPFDSTDHVVSRLQRLLPGPQGRPLVDSLVPDPAEPPFGGSRLVAVRLKPEAQVAWTVGVADNFGYQVLSAQQTSAPSADSVRDPAPARQQPVVTQAAVTQAAATQLADRPVTAAQQVPEEDSAAPFAGHRFLGIPLVHDQSLFVITSDEEQLFLNCLVRASGRLQWRQPLIFDDSGNNQRDESRMALARSMDVSALCGVSGDAVICSLPNGILIAVRRSDGQLKWATDCGEPLQEFDRFRPYYSHVRPKATSPCHPVIVGDRIIWAAPESDQLTCVDAASGLIHWQVSRQATGPGLVSGSVDSYIAGSSTAGSGQTVILLGPRHIRAVEAGSGDQIWATEIPPQTGRAVCSQQLCLIPARDGSIVSVDLQTGRPDTLATVLQRSARRLQQQLGTAETDNDSAVTEATDAVSAFVAGSLTADDEVICAATPAGLTVIPTASAVHRRLIATAADDTPSAQRRLAQATAELLTGTPDAALRRLLHSATSEPDAAVLQSLLADTLLHRLAELRFAGESQPTVDRDHARGASSDLISDSLQGLAVTEEQAWRRQLLLPSDAVNHLLPDSARHPFPMLNLLPDWRVRADIAAYSLLPSDQADLLTGQPRSTSAVAAIEHAISFPQNLGSLQQQQAFAEVLVQQRQFAAAELLLLAVLENADPDQRTQLRTQLISLRQAATRAPQQQSGAAEFAAEFAGDSAVVQASVRETLLNTLDRHFVSTLASGLRSQLDAPAWYNRGLVSVPTAAGDQLTVLDFDSGSVSHQLQLPPGLHSGSTLSDSLQRPGLLPLTGENQLGMVSLTAAGGPRILWHKRIQRQQPAVLRLAAGLIGQGYFIWRSDQQLNCSHPLTGRHLWSRDLVTETAATSGVYNEGLAVAGDHQVVAAFSDLMNSYQLFRTSDGQHLRHGQLQIPETQMRLAIGRRLLYVDDNGQVRLLDLLTDQQVLNPPTPLTVADYGRFARLTNDRVLVITETDELAVINAATATVECRCSLPVAAGAGYATGLAAFERQGRLYAMLKNYRQSDPTVTAAPLLREPRLDFGTLVCVDLQTESVLWTRPTQPAVVPPIYGDPTDLLVTWSVQNPRNVSGQGGGRFFGEEIRSSGRERVLSLQLIDGRTGQLVLEQPGLSPFTPLRCVHHASAQELRIETEHSVITVDYHRLGETR